VREVGEAAFVGCTSLSTVILPDHKIKVGAGAFAACDALEVLVLSDSVHGIRRKCIRWQVAERANVILHSELKLAIVFSKLGKPETEDGHKKLLRAEARRLLKQVKKRNNLHSTATLRENIASAAQAIEEQINPTEEEITPTEEESSSPAEGE
jgi:hypothetical protein